MSFLTGELISFLAVVPLRFKLAANSVALVRTAFLVCATCMTNAGFAGV